MRFHEPTGGRITLDGVDTAAMTREELRSGTGMVLQDTWLFGGTIAENIAYGVPGEVSRERIVAAARAAHADRFVRTLPDGYDTVLDEDGGGLSAGEKQLVTLARAFSPTRWSSSSTRPPAPSTPAPSSSSSGPCPRCARAAPASSWPTGSPRSATPTPSW